MWVDLEHQIWKSLKQLEPLKDKKFILAVSGGLDSMCLLNIFSRLGLGPQSYVAHVHHGDFENKDYRDQAQDLVKSVCQQRDIRYVSIKAEDPLKSEDQFRNFRLDFFEKLKKSDEILVTAHQQNDLLETRLIRLIRGTHTEGLVSFKSWNGQTLRPLLGFSRDQLQSYAKEQGVSYLDDPSNLQQRYLRNWIRGVWLPDLEAYHPGAVKNLARSLDYLIEEIDRKDTSLDCEIKTRQNEFGNEYFVDKVDFLSLSTKDQMKTIAEMIKISGQRDFSAGHLREILKRLDKNQKEHTFDLLGRKWVILSHEIVLRFY